MKTKEPMAVEIQDDLSNCPDITFKIKTDYISMIENAIESFRDKYGTNVTPIIEVSRDVYDSLIEKLKFVNPDPKTRWHIISTKIELQGIVVRVVKGTMIIRVRDEQCLYGQVEIGGE